MIKAILLLMSILYLNGCEYFSGNRIMNINIQASSQLNPDIHSRASPITLSLYQLKEKIPFQNLSYSSLTAHTYQSLKKSLVDCLVIQLQPSQFKLLKIKLKNNTNYLGVVAAYRELENAHWKQIIELSRSKHLIKTELRLVSNAINLHSKG